MAKLSKTPLPDGRGSEGGRGSEKEYADKAMALLQHAVAKGYKNAGHMKQDKDLDVLRDRDDFKKLLAELEAK